MKREVEYFEKGGLEQTEKCLGITEKLIGEGYKNIVVATTSGKTGLLFAKKFQGREINLAVVTHSAGFKKLGEIEVPEETRKGIIALGARVYTGTILTHSLETALAKEFQGVYPTLLIAQTLRRFSQGVKVAVEIVMEACDGGILPEGEEVIAVGGTGHGADTVCLIKSAASKRFLELQVLEILAKPR
jgi:hypothetical protein